MTWFWSILPVLVGLLSATVVYGRKSLQHVACERDSDEGKIFIYPLWARVFGTTAPAAFSIAALVYLYVQSAQGGTAAALAILACMSIIAAALALAASVDAAKSFVEITADKLRARSMIRSMEIDLIDIDEVVTHSAYIGVRLRNHQVLTISGSMGLNAKMRRYLVARVLTKKTLRRAGT